MRFKRLKDSCFRALSVAVICILVIGCSKGGSSTDTVKEDDATLEMAVIKGREAARYFVNLQSTDTMALQNALLKARSMQSDFVTKGHKRAAEQFDTAFVDSLKAIKPELAKDIENYCK